MQVFKNFLRSRLILETPASRLRVDGRKGIKDTIKTILVPKRRDPFGQRKDRGLWEP